MKSGEINTIRARHQCITCTHGYQDKSLEELRLEDYRSKRGGFWDEVSDLKAEHEAFKIENEKRVSEISKERDSLEAKLEDLNNAKPLLSENGRKEREMATEIQSLNNEVHDPMNDHQGEVSDLNGKIESLKISYEKKVAEISKERDSLEAKLEGLSITKSVMSEDGRKEKEWLQKLNLSKQNMKRRKIWLGN